MSYARVAPEASRPVAARPLGPASRQAQFSPALTLLGLPVPRTRPSVRRRAASAGGKYLYAEAGGAAAVDEFQVNSDGSLSAIGSVAGLGAGIEGIAAS